MKKLLMLAALAAVVLAGTVYGEADTRRDGTKFNPAQSPVRLYLVRTVDSTGTKAGRRDSVAWSNVVGQLPVPQTVGGVYDADTSSRAFRTTNEGYLRTDDAARDRDSYLEPVQIMTARTIAAGAADTTDIVDLSGYRTVALLVQCTFGSAAADSQAWQRYAVQCRYNLGGQADSLSLFSIPVQGGDSSGVFVRWTGQTPTAGVFGPDEFPVTIVNTKSHPSAQTVSTPQGRVVPLLMPYSASGWPARCSFRIRNVARPKAASVAPTVRVWVMGTPL